jgi:sucrose-phosphate synthase
MEKVSGLHKKYKSAVTIAFSDETRYRNRAIVTDLDQSLIGNPDALNRFSKFIKENRKRITFGIATGRRIDSALAIMKKHGIPAPDILISSIGTRIHYGKGLAEDSFWAEHINHNWNRFSVRRILDDLPGIKIQPKIQQTPFKISYYYDPQIAPTIDEIITNLLKQEVTANVMLSFGQFIDIVPSRASKGQALRYVAQKVEIPLEKILVAGGSGTDEDMMRGNTLAVVVSNRHNEELSQLIDQDKIYFAKKDRAEGILEAVEHYDFFNI